MEEEFEANVTGVSTSLALDISGYMNTLDKYFKMPTGGVTTRNNATPKSANAKKQSKETIVSESSPKFTPAEKTTCTMDSIQAQLSEINNELKRTIKVNDIKSIIKGVVEELFQNHQETIEKKLYEEVTKLREENEKLRNENKRLARDIGDHDEVINDLYNKLEENVMMTKTAVSKANYNEQYSRKNNIKFHGFHENKGEDLLQVLNEVLLEVGTEIEEKDLVAIHRIPGQKDRPRPILIKLRNAETKARVMRKRSSIKALRNKVKVTDDVTKDNSELISKLLKDERMNSAWYFNGSVYGQCGNRRIKFDLFDDIDKKLRKK